MFRKLVDLKKVYIGTPGKAWRQGFILKWLSTLMKCDNLYLARVCHVITDQQVPGIFHYDEWWHGIRNPESTPAPIRVISRFSIPTMPEYWTRVSAVTAG